MRKIGGGLSALVIVVAFSACRSQPAGEAAPPGSLELLNVSYDPTRELWRAINAEFIPAYEKEAGVKLAINQSHGGSSTQARAVIDGLDADVVTLALWSDTDAIAKRGLINPGWKERAAQQLAALHVDHRVRRPQGQSEGNQGLAGPGPARRGDRHAEPEDVRQRSVESLQRLGIGRAARRVTRSGGGLRHQALQAGPGAGLWRARRDDHVRAEENRRRPPCLGERSAPGGPGGRAASWTSSIRRSASAPSRTSPSSIRTSIGRRRAPRRKPTSVSSTRSRRRRSSRSTSIARRMPPCSPGTLRRFPR